MVWSGHGDALELAEVDPATGNLTAANRFSYSTWGTPTLTTVNSYGDLGFRYRYVGRFDVQWDSTAAVPAELLYMHARHYAPEFGRFLQPDPSDAEDNLYWYTGNNPPTKLDPDGTYQCILAAVGGPWGIVVACGLEIVVLGAAAMLLTHHGNKLISHWCGNGRCRLAIRTTPATGHHGYRLCYFGYINCNARVRVPRNAWLPKWAEKAIPGGAHELKRQWRAGGNVDIWVDGDGDLILKPKGRPDAEGTDTGLDVGDLKGAK